MSVTSAYVIDAGRHVVETHTDHLGQKYVQTFVAPEAWTTQQIIDRVTEHGAELNGRLADAELETLIG